VEVRPEDQIDARSFAPGVCLDHGPGLVVRSDDRIKGKGEVAHSVFELSRSDRLEQCGLRIE